MPLASSYPVVTPTTDDLLIGTNGSDGKTKNFTVAAVVALAGAQPLDSDLTAIAALTTTSFGRALLALADAAATRTTLGLGTAAVVDTGTSAANVPTITQADARYQPLDSDLTAIAALTTTSFGRALLALADAAALRTAGGLGGLAVLSAVTASLISDASANGRSLITATDYAAMRTLLGLVIGTNVQAQDAELAALAGLTSAADKLPYFTGSGTAALTDMTAFARTMLDDANAAAVRTTIAAASSFVPYARTIQGSAQNISSWTVTTISMTSASDDNDTMWSAGTPTYLTVKTAGVYLARGFVCFSSNTVGGRLVMLIRIGDGLSLGQASSPSVGEVNLPVSSDPTTLSVGDQICLKVYQDSTSTLTTFASSVPSTLSLIRIA